MLCPYSSVRINPITGKKQLTPCGKCIPCRVAWRLPWEYRLYYELRSWNYQGSFVTMTYSNDKYDVNLGLNYNHVRNFFHDLRKRGFNFRYFVTGEYGEQTARCHWHALLFGIPCSARYEIFKSWEKWCYYPEFVASPITQGRIRYTLKYMDKESVSVDFENETKVHKFEFLLNSCLLKHSEYGWLRPRSYCSKGLGSANFNSRFLELYNHGYFSEGSTIHKPSKYQLDSISRNDVLFQIFCRSKFKERSFYYNQALKSNNYDEVLLQKNSFVDAQNMIKLTNLKEIQQGNHIKPVTDLDFFKSFTDFKLNFDSDFKKEVKRVSSLSWKNVNNDLARLALSC